MAQLICDHLSLGYDAHEIVRDLSFSVQAGDYLCIVGENGAGKTTLMKTLLGLHAPISGTVHTGDGMKPNEIGYLPQQTLAQRDFPASVREVVLSGCQGRCGLRPYYKKAEKRLAEECMKRMGLGGLARHSYRELSGGQQQRVLLARALCATQKLLLLDEPVSGLDPKAAETMYELIEKLNGEGVTVLMISHDVRSVVKSASHILHMGETIFFGTKEEYLDSEIGQKFVSVRGGGQG
ncbi:MAG: ABC transporter ATP-binding protein [Lachnospiraceae bacterium]|nr:ABC transporter ATP-binding protein [Lachnospiraceae bacterium]MCI9356332.1 ABC transporter ATP-binding protein [Lachnospiraceae bacterium]